MCRLLAVLLVLPSLALAQGKAGTQYAFLVAVSKYDETTTGLKALPFTVKDVEGFRDALLATGYKAENIRLLHDRLPEDQNPGLRLTPEKNKILADLGRLMKVIDPEDSLIVVLNGHGVHFKGNKTSHFCPLDADLNAKENLLPMDGPGGLYPLLETCKAKSKLLIAGMCRNDPKDFPADTQAAEQIDLSTPETPPAGIAALYSCEAGQKTYFDKTQGSYFFHHLSAAWHGEYAGDEDLTLDSVFASVRTRTKKDVFTMSGGLKDQFPEVRRKYDGTWNIPKAVRRDKTRPFDLGNGVKLVMVRIPAKGKKFVMGSPESEESRGKDEEPHDVTFGHDYYMGKFEVTQEQYEAITGKNPSKFTGAKNPAETVSWDEAKTFIEKLNEKLKDQNVTFRLPSEAEWEYACRAGTTTPFHFGKELNGKQANSNGKYPYGTTVEGPSLEKTTPVGGYAANDFGLHDMHGNVWEWCEDYYGPYSAAPKDGKAKTIKQSNDVRVLRGGSWYLIAVICRSAIRNNFAPGDRYSNIGFRVAFSPQD